MVGMGYTREEIKEALSTHKYNEVTATYLLLGRRGEVGDSGDIVGMGDIGDTGGIGDIWDLGTLWGHWGRR